MPDIKNILKNEDFGSIVGDLCVDTRENRNPREYMEEYNGDRTRRKESVGYREPKKIAVYSDTEVEIDPETGAEKPKTLFHLNAPGPRWGLNPLSQQLCSHDG